MSQITSIDSTTSRRPTRSNTDKTKEKLPSVPYCSIERKRTKSLNEQSFKSETVELTQDNYSTSTTQSEKKETQQQSTFILWIEWEFDFDSEYFAEPFDYSKPPPATVHRPIIIPKSVIMADTQDDLKDDRDTLTDRIQQIKTVLDNHAAVAPAAAVPMSKDLVELKIEDLQAIKTELDQIGKRTRRLFRGNTQLQLQAAIDLSTALFQEWEKVTLQAQQVKAALAAQTISRVKIPKAEPPQFDGQSVNWPSFLDQFNSLVVSNSQVSPTDKLALLKKSLEKGTAHHIVQNFSLTDIDWTNAWAAVKGRYDHERELAYAHLTKLFELIPITQQTQGGLRNIVDTVNEVIRALKNLNVETDNWDLILTFIIRKNLDNRTRTDFEKSLADDKIHTLQVLIDYLNNLATALGSATIIKPKESKDSKSNKTASEDATSSRGQTTNGESSSYQQKKSRACVFCTQLHWNAKCPTLLPLTPAQRIKLAKDKKLCLNCLGFATEKHKNSTCNRNPCGVNGCQLKHHALLHYESKATSNSTSVVEQKKEDKPAAVSLSASENGGSGLNVILATASVNLIIHNKIHKVRALIDQCSQVNLMTEKLVNKLQLTRKPSTVSINGIGNSKSNFAQGTTAVQIQSNVDPSWKTHINCYILSEITGNKPSHHYDVTAFDQFRNLKLADEKFNVPGPVDLILGAQVFTEILGNHHFKGLPSAIDTKLGYIITGEFDLGQNSESMSTLTCDVDFDLTRFWKQEEVHERQEFSPTELEVEEHYASNTIQESNGKFVVALPFVPHHKPLGESRHQAVKRLFHIERKLDKYPEKKLLYHTGMQDYIESGHLKKIPLKEMKKLDSEHFYLPHHYVEKESSSTSFRIVFDGSAKSTTGISLNDVLQTGPTIQPDLVTTLLRFREHKYVFTTDIKKMYLQVGIKDQDQDFLRVLWRESPFIPIEDYKFTVVPFGTTSSPYLAIKTIQQLAKNHEQEFPLGARILLHCFYVDDCLSGGNNLLTVKNMQSQLIQLTAKGGFKLRKWSSNHPDVLEAIPIQDRETKLPLELESTDKVKTLGILWNAASDTFSFKVNLPEETVFTKRKVASYAAKTYDATGLIQPVIIKAKIILQELWESKTDWDEEIPPHIHASWKQYIDELKKLEKIQIPRHFIPNDPERLIFHGFSDASQKAYGAMVYVVGISSIKDNTSHLLTSKSKVAPLRMATLPRLELMGAVLLAKLMKSVIRTLKNKPDEIHLWSDSSIVLRQILKPSRSFKTFVGNRISYIQENSDVSSWHYVKTDENPADLVSRGKYPSELLDNKFWWNGPDWLKTNKLPIVQIPGCLSNTDFEELPQVSSLSASARNNWVGETLNSFNSLLKLKRTTVFILRRFKKELTPKPRKSVLMTVEELNIATSVWIKLVQSEEFKQEIHWLKTNQEFPNINKIKSLNPFMDSNDILRVGGRLNEADGVSEDMKHPILLPKNHRLVRLIVQDTHERYKHAAPLLLTSIIRSQYWIIGLKPAINRCIKNCITCQRISAEIGRQMMGNLPKSRISKARAFLHTGIDYAGPIYVLPKSGRGQKTIKTWIAVFVCYTTKAVHLELVSELTTKAFIAALKRFAARRGKPQILYSDEGTNFTGARNEMLEFQKEMEAISTHHDVARSLAEDGIHWKLNPPGSPHMGGLWEAAVKSMKKHLRRSSNSTHFTIEEMTTLLCEIEACLNSRPLTPMSNDPNDLAVLTPGHFLVGEPLSTIPGPDLTQVKMNRLDRWEIIQQQKTHFWNRWSSEYLHILQNRPKWLSPKRNFQEGDLVIIKDESLAPSKWKIGRITETHPGKDGHVRVVTVKTSTTKIIPQQKGMKYLDKFQSHISTLKRPIHKLVRLPYDFEEPDNELDQVDRNEKLDDNPSNIIDKAKVLESTHEGNCI